MSDELLCRPYFKVRGTAVPNSGSVVWPIPKLKTAYNIPPQFGGKNSVIGYIELGGGINGTDNTIAFGQLGIPVPTLQLVSVMGVGNAPGSDADGEVAFDFQVGGQMAWAAVHRMYFAPNSDVGFPTAIEQAVKDQCTHLSISWGGPEGGNSPYIQNMMAALLDAQNKKVGVYVAAGDNGSSDGLPGNHADFPASCPYVTGVGGTSMPSSATEVVWNNGNLGGATGGGVSALFKIPLFQNPAFIPGVGRGVPDVSALADPGTGIPVVLNGQTQVFGGTSGGAPFWAGFAAILDEIFGQRLGNLNTILYSLPPGTMRDITSGGNGTFQARKGYDCCTGNGSPNGTAMIAAMQGVITPPITPPPTTTPGPLALITGLDATGKILWSAIPQPGNKLPASVTPTVLTPE